MDLQTDTPSFRHARMRLEMDDQVVVVADEALTRGHSTSVLLRAGKISEQSIFF